ncbi:MAG: DUF732 domain-containing protein [Cyanobacteria bacterium CRU_2_1]|nr:DUF732 domain-containing protein [Cyanobacteria bacterium RU_5_0]NJR62077.1 DUF732 domain-containing protein [Cyanobacteria bacterium CRU_2_1]
MCNPLQIVLLISLLSTTLVSTTLATPLFTRSEEPPEEPPSQGICGLYTRSGFLIIDESNQVITLTDYCRGQRERDDIETSQFWQNFEAAATSETIAFAKSQGEADVVAYGITICPFLERGGTMGELREMQADGDLPSAFEIAVTLAAIHTYCPAYRSEIGR